MVNLLNSLSRQERGESYTTSQSSQLLMLSSVGVNRAFYADGNVDTV